jgi:phospholipase/carboxylesterase
VLGLHGRGDTAQAFSRVAGQLGPRLAWRFLGAPLPWREGRAWFSDHQRAAPEAEIASALAAIDEQVQLAGRRPLAMFGFSQGCMMLLRYVALHPQALRAGVCIGGAVVGDLPTPDDRPTSPILFVHGADDKVVPASAAREAIQAMENRGFATEFIEHGAGHSIPGQEVSRISDWLRARLALDQPRQTAPD